LLVTAPSSGESCANQIPSIRMAKTCRAGSSSPRATAGRSLRGRNGVDHVASCQAAAVRRSCEGGLDLARAAYRRGRRGDGRHGPARQESPSDAREQVGAVKWSCATRRTCERRGPGCSSGHTGLSRRRAAAALPNVIGGPARTSLVVGCPSSQRQGQQSIVSSGHCAVVSLMRWTMLVN
jgi:hypothetical protein